MPSYIKLNTEYIEGAFCACSAVFISVIVSCKPFSLAISASSPIDRATQGLMQRYRNQVPPQQLAMLKGQIRKDALENLINQELLVEEADKSGQKPSPEEVDARYKELAARFPTPEAFQNVLSGMGMTEESFRKELAMNLQIEGMMQKMFDKLPPITEEQVKKYYDEHKEEFDVPEQVQASHILIAVDKEDTEEAKAEKKRIWV